MWRVGGRRHRRLASPVSQPLLRDPSRYTDDSNRVGTNWGGDLLSPWGMRGATVRRWSQPPRLRRTESPEWDTNKRATSSGNLMAELGLAAAPTEGTEESAWEEHRNRGDVGRVVYSDEAIVARRRPTRRRTVPARRVPITRDDGVHTEHGSYVRFRENLDLAIMTFNRWGAESCFDALFSLDILDEATPLAIAAFLFFVPGLDKVEIGRVLGGHSHFSLKVLQRFIHLFCFSNADITTALRLLFSKFQPPGESQQLFRVLKEFAYGYASDNPTVSADDVLLLAYAILMLHTDRHNPRVRRKMSREDFVKLVPQSAADETNQVVFDKKFLEQVYNDVTSTEFQIVLSDADAVYSRLAKASSALCPRPPSDRLLGEPCVVDRLTSIMCRPDIDDLLRSGATFLKYCRNGSIKLRVVRLSEDGLRLTWAPEGEPTTDERRRSRREIDMEDVLDITLGPATPVFKRFRIPGAMHRHCCSIHTTSRTLDLCAPLGVSPTIEIWAAALLLKAQILRRARRGRGREKKVAATWDARRASVDCVSRRVPKDQGSLRRSMSAATTSETTATTTTPWRFADPGGSDDNSIVTADDRHTRIITAGSPPSETDDDADAEVHTWTTIFPAWWSHWDTRTFQSSQTVEAIPRYIRTQTNEEQIPDAMSPGDQRAATRVLEETLTRGGLIGEASASDPRAQLPDDRRTELFFVSLCALQGSLYRDPRLFRRLVSNRVRVPCVPQDGQELGRHSGRLTGERTVPYVWDMAYLDLTAHPPQHGAKSRKWTSYHQSFLTEQLHRHASNRSPEVVKAWWSRGLPRSLRAHLWILALYNTLRPPTLLFYDTAADDRPQSTPLGHSRPPNSAREDDAITMSVLRVLGLARPYLDPRPPSLERFVRILLQEVSATPSHAFAIVDGILACEALPLVDIYLVEHDVYRKQRVAVRLQLFQALLAHHARSLFLHFKALDIEPLYYVTPWMRDLFAGTFPTPCLLRVWDRLVLGQEVRKRRGK